MPNSWDYEVNKSNWNNLPGPSQQQVMDRLTWLREHLLHAQEAVAGHDFREAIAEIHQLAVWSDHLMDDMVVKRNAATELKKLQEQANAILRRSE